METQIVVSNRAGKIVFTAVLLTILFMHDSSAQKIWEARKGCIRAQGNLAPGYLFSQKFLAAYVTGEAEVFLDDRAAVNGAVWASFATNMKNTVGLTANHALFTGMNYHFLKPGRFDPYIGFSPGAGLVRAAYRNSEGILQQGNFTIAPLISASAGCNYYVGWFFHFFVKVQGVTGQTFSNLPEPIRLDELKITAGLGWNVRAWKPKKKDVWKERNRSN